MQKNAKKKQHFIPKAYLKNFSFNGTNIFIYNKRIQKRFRNTIDNICYSDYFYRVPERFISKSKQIIDPDIFEKEFFSQSIENFFGKFLSRINKSSENWIKNPDKSSIFSDEEKLEFSQLLAIQYLRMPNIRSKYGDVTEKATNKSIEIIESGLGYKKDSAKLSYDREYNSIVHSQLYANENLIREISTHLINKNWTFFVSPLRDVFTSDNPILIKPHIPNEKFLLEGFGMKGAEIIFPIGNSVLLSITDDEFCDLDLCDMFTTISSKKLREYNFFQYIWANEEVYSFNNNFEIIDQLKQANGNNEVFIKKAIIKVNGK